MEGSTTLIGAFSYGDFEHIIGEGDLIVGKFCSIGNNVSYILWGHHPEWFSTYPFGVPHLTPNCQGNPAHPVRGKIIIGNDVYIGSNTTILYGSTIGDGAVISAGSVVRGRVKPYTVVGGNPASFIYTRFNKEVIDMLLAIKWWDLDYDIIRKYAPVLQSNDVEKLRAFYNEIHPNK